MTGRRIPLSSALGVLLLAGCLDHPSTTEPLRRQPPADAIAPSISATGHSPLERVRISYESPTGKSGALTADVMQFMTPKDGRRTGPAGETALQVRIAVTHVDAVVQAPAISVTLPMLVRAAGVAQPPCESTGTVEIVLAPGGWTDARFGRLEATQLAVHDPAWKGGGGVGRIVCGITHLLETRASPSTIAAHLDNLLRELRDLDPFDLGRLTEILSADSPPASTRIGEFIEVRLLGKGRLATEQPSYPDHSDRATGPDRPEEVEGSAEAVPLHVFNTRTLNEFELRIAPSLLREIHTLRAGNGQTIATEGVDNPERLERGGALVDAVRASSPTARFARTGGVDGRTIFNATTTWPWRAISQFTYGSTDNSGCTGTLIGPRHLVTNAHCINNAGTSTWLTATVSPGRNGASGQPYGSSTISTSPAAGTEAWYFTPAPWRDPNAENRGQWDYGIIVIPDRLGDQTGWMGYAARSASQLSEYFHYNRGYPQCGSGRPDEPVNCQTARLYGDASSCTLGRYIWTGGNGWNRAFHHSCDTSAGHSGSPVYHYEFDPALKATVPVVSAVHFFSTCDRTTNSPCESTDVLASRARRFDPVTADVISFFRQAFP